MMPAPAPASLGEMATPGSAEPVVTVEAPAKLTLAEVRARLDGKSGKRFWKNLDELAETPGFHEMLAEEFPRLAGGAATMPLAMTSISAWACSMETPGLRRTTML